MSNPVTLQPDTEFVTHIVEQMSDFIPTEPFRKQTIDEIDLETYPYGYAKSFCRRCRDDIFKIKSKYTTSKESARQIKLKCFADILDILGIKYELNYTLGFYTYDIYVVNRNVVINICNNYSDNLYQCADWGFRNKVVINAALFHTNCINLYDDIDFWKVAQSLQDIVPITSKNIEILQIDRIRADLFCKLYDYQYRDEFAKYQVTNFDPYGVIADGELIQVVVFHKMSTNKGTVRNRGYLRTVYSPNNYDTSYTFQAMIKYAEYYDIKYLYSRLDWDKMDIEIWGKLNPEISEIGRDFNILPYKFVKDADSFRMSKEYKAEAKQIEILSDDWLPMPIAYTTPIKFSLELLERTLQDE